MKPKALILGAGVAGLAAAWWLGRNGWDCLVVERAESMRSGGYVMGLSGPGYQAVERMGLLPAIRRSSIPPGRSVYRDSKDRELMVIDHKDHLKGMHYLIIRRGDLVFEIAQALGADFPMRLGATVTAIDNRPDGVTVTLSDGSEENADLLIVAEGVHSATRALLFADCPDPLRFMGYRFAAYDVEAADGLTDDFTGFVAPGHTAEIYRLGEARMAALHVWASHQRRPPGGSAELEEIAALHAEDPSLVRDALAAAEQGAIRPVIDDLLMVEAERWSAARAVLLGDAAHCVSLISGQGAGMALAGAAVLADALENAATIEAGLAAYEARLRPSIERLQARSRSIARWFVPRSRVAHTVRNTIIRALPRPILTRYFQNTAASELQHLSNFDHPTP